jgi:D-3-phosphoglycerate dehydrogenase
MRKIVFADSTHPVLPQLLEEAGFHCLHFPEKDLEKFVEIIRDAYGIIIRSKFPMNEAVLKQAKNLAFIGRVGAGMENIDLNYCMGREIELLNAPEGNRDAVAEHSLGMLLAMTNRLLIADHQVRKGLWKREENRGIELMGKTIALIGYGNMGGAFAQRLQGLRAQVIAYDKYKTDYSDEWVQEVSMQEVFRLADVVSLHIPLTEESHYLVNESWINSFEKSFYLINTSRGKIINTKDLVKGLVEGKIRSAALDVLEYESHSFENLLQGETPKELEFLIQSQQLILTPHIAGWTHESHEKLARVLVNKILSRNNNKRSQ